MENSEALRIIKILADGIDPTTGEVFPLDSSYQHPNVIRALYAAVLVMERQAVREAKSNRLPPNAGKPWDSIEERKVVEAFKNGISIPEIARKHNRTPGAIEARLSKNGLI